MPVRGDIGHQRHNGRAIDGHARNKEHHQQHPDNERGGKVALQAVAQERGDCLVKWQQREKEGRYGDADDNEGHTPPYPRAHPVAERADDRIKKQRQNIVERHYETDYRGTADVVPEKDRHVRVVQRPRNARGKKPQADDKSFTIIQFFFAH